MPCLLYWSTYARFFVGGRARLPFQPVNFFVRCLVSVSYYFFVGGSSTCKFFEHKCLVLLNFPRWYFENFLNHAPNFCWVARPRINFLEFSQPRRICYLYYLSTFYWRTFDVHVFLGLWADLDSNTDNFLTWSISPIFFSPLDREFFGGTVG